MHFDRDVIIPLLSKDRMQRAKMLMAAAVCVPHQGFDAFRADETLCDVVLIPGDSKESFQVHRVIMASSSDYFKAMFTGELRAEDRLKCSS